MLSGILYFVISFLASLAGAICGIGGGVVIRPVLDLFGVAGVSTISFLSGCTVLSMSCYSVGRNLLSGDNRVDMKTGSFLAVGAAVGGVIGKQLFAMIGNLFGNADAVGTVQSACLAAVTIAAFVYTLRKNKIREKHIHSMVLCLVIGLMLGIMSSFLGIGGGPINLVVLFYFFSMEIKTAAQNSLYIILVSQIASLITTLVTGSVPEFEPMALILMVAGGIGGGFCGHLVNKHIESRTVNKLFLSLMVLIIAISIWNTLQYAGVL